MRAPEHRKNTATLIEAAMDFQARLEHALDLWEAKRLVRQRQGPSGQEQHHRVVYDHDEDDRIGVVSSHGWQIAVYDQVHSAEAAREHDLLKARAPSVIKKIAQFIGDIDDGSINIQRVFRDLVDHMERQFPWAFNVLKKIQIPIGKLGADDYDEAMRAVSVVYPAFLKQVARDIGLSEIDVMVINVRDIAPVHSIDEADKPLSSLLSIMWNTVHGLRQRLPEYTKELFTNINKQQHPKFTLKTPVVAWALGAVQDVLIRVKALGVRRSAAVPIKVHFVRDYPQSGYGTGQKVGDADPGQRSDAQVKQGRQDTHRVNVYITGKDNDESIKEVVAHEIGHILFSINQDVQALIATMAHGRVREASHIAGGLTGSSQRATDRLREKTPAIRAPSDYGRSDYVYTGATDVSVNHYSGNEWMAEMFAALVTGKEAGDFPPNQVRVFKMALAIINGHPHAGISYRSGQMSDKWAPIDFDLPEIAPVDISGLSPAAQKSVRRRQEKAPAKKPGGSKDLGVPKLEVTS